MTVAVNAQAVAIIFKMAHIDFKKIGDTLTIISSALNCVFYASIVTANSLKQYMLL